MLIAAPSAITGVTCHASEGWKSMVRSFVVNAP
jgi:hypothetical protein